MLNKNNERELAYVVKVNKILPIPNADNIELAQINGWQCIVKKTEFNQGDLGIFFEIDSKVDETNPVFNFMAAKHYKVKTMKLNRFGGVVSQGLLMPFSVFGWEPDKYAEGTFLTKELGVTYSVVEDNFRKADKNPDAKINAALNRHPKIAKKYGKTIKKNKVLRTLFLLIFGRKKDNRSWPSHIAAKTDVERIQNMPWILEDKNPYVATEKIDGSSCSIMAERTKFGKVKYYICSRNVVFEDENQKCYYDENIYFEAYNKYNLKEKITQILNDYKLPNVALQMEIFGPRVQKRDYSLKEHQAMIFHIVSNGQKFSMDKVVEICDKYDLPHVPIIDDNFVFPDTLEELQTYVEGEGSKVDGKPREGIVFYDKATGQQYTKFVSPNFLMKYHS